MKRILCLICILIGIMVGNVTILRAETNMNGGGAGGGTQAGTKENFFVSGDDGVRITVVDNRTKRRAEGTRTIDYYRLSKSGKPITHFGKISKIEYMGTGGYSSIRDLANSPENYKFDAAGNTVAFQVEDLPTIVSTASSNTDIEKIKAYFNVEGRLKGIASKVGLSYQELINGNYKVLIEPMIYITFQGCYVALTAHEAAKLDMALGGTANSGGQLRAKFVSYTHKNLPLSIFLRKKDLGIRPWNGSKYGKVQNGSILTYLGIGILSFTPQGNDVDLDSGGYVYRPNTDVITTVNVSITDGDPDGATCDNPLTVRFEGEYIATTYVTGITIPQGGNRPVWIKWRTPDIKESIRTTIKATITKGGIENESIVIPITIAPIKLLEPKNPIADDQKPQKWSAHIQPQFPTTAILKKFQEPVEKLSWHTYICTKQSVLDHYENVKNGNKIVKIPIYNTVYNFTKNEFTSQITYTKVLVTPDSVTVKDGANPSLHKVKSGYGIEVKVTSNISGSSANCSGFQNFCAYFPEFEYKKYRRIGSLPGASLISTLELPINLYSIRKNRIHFTPIWYPDIEYKVYIELLDAWTPAGMLCSKTTGSIDIKGNMWDNWYIREVIDFK